MRIPESVLVNYAKRRGISVEEAKGMADVLNKRDNADDGFGEVRDFLGNFADLNELTMGLPQQAQNALAPHLPMLAMGAAGSSSRKNGTSDIADAIRDIGLFKESMRVLNTEDEKPPTDESSAALGTYLETLTERLTEIEKRMFDKQEDEKLDKLTEFITSVTAKYDETIEAVKAASGSEKKKSAIDELVETAETLEKSKERLRNVGLLGEEKPESANIEDAVASLRERGYQVKEPQSYADIEKLLADYEKSREEEWKLREEEVKREVLDTEERRERNMRMMMDLGGGLLDTVVSAMTSRDETGVTGLTKLRGMIGRSYGVGEGTPTGETE
jgi:hypothetical protein